MPRLSTKYCLPIQHVFTDWINRLLKKTHLLRQSV
jgi:hypothetical protein